MNSHAKLAPSAAHRWLECPGSVAACEGLADDESVFAAEGTFAHAIAADCLEEGTDAAVEIGTVSHCGRFTFDEADAGFVQSYLDVVRELAAAPGAELLVERKVMVDDIVYGTADAIILGESFVDIVDLKYGRGLLVDAVENPQLRIYGYGATKTYNRAPGVVRVHVVQPRHPQGGHSFETLLAEELYDWVVTVLEPGIEAAAGATLGATSDVRQAGDWCRFCLAKADCPAIRAKSLEAASSVFSDVESMTPAKRPPRPTDLAPAELAKILDVAPLVEDWLAAVRERAYEIANSGTAVPGRKLVRKKSLRKWTDEAAVEEMLMELLPDDVSPFAPAKLLSPAQAEKKLDLLGAAMVAKLTKKPDTGMVLVSSSDKRAAIKPGDVFSELEN